MTFSTDDPATFGYAGGYLNESGKINVQRLQLVLNELAVFERETFESHYADNNWHKGAGQKKVASFEKARSKGKPGTFAWINTCRAKPELSLT